MIAACKTERELANDIAKEYETFLKNPFVNVVVAEQRSQSFGVIGAVEKPGSFYISRRIQLLELLALAGGPNKEAGSRLIIARTGSSAACRRQGEAEAEVAFLNFRIRDIQEGKANVWMRPGDVVSVLDADLIYVYGSVKKPGEVKMKEPLTLRQAIASAEGFTSTAATGNIRVLRQVGDAGEWSEVKYDLKDIDRGKIKDPVLAPNDIVAVSGDAAKSILQGLARSVTGGLGNLPVVLR
jgi:polysaccharide export outer membrane protein